MFKGCKLHFVHTVWRQRLKMNAIFFINLDLCKGLRAVETIKDNGIGNFFLVD